MQKFWVKAALALTTLSLVSGAHAQSTSDAGVQAKSRAFDVAGYDQLLSTRWSLFPHKGSYLLPFSYTATPHEDLYNKYKSDVDPGNNNDFYKKEEAEFQISFMLPIYRKIAESDWDLLFAYTHHAWWQIYNEPWSKPFRETNYMPELFFRKLNRNSQVAGMDLVAFDAGYMHQSNGQVQGLSRGWDRLFARAYLMSSSTAAIITMWARVDDGGPYDDNSDIYDYMGIGEVELAQSFGPNSIRVKVPLAKIPSLELQYTYPWREHLRWIVSLRSGYGHSLIGYDRQDERIGIGLALENFLDQPSGK
jgi:Outer membrane phospholipase A